MHTKFYRRAPKENTSCRN